MSGWVERLGWALVHSIWLGAVIWALLRVVLLFLRERSSQARYLVSCAALALMMIAPWMDFTTTDFSARWSEALRAKETAADAESFAASKSNASNLPQVNKTKLRVVASSSAELKTSPAQRPDWLLSLRWRMQPFLPFLVAGWFAGVALFTLRLTLGWRRVQRLVNAPLDGISRDWRQRFERLCQRAGVRKALCLGETALVAVPTVVGWFKPVILLPVGVLSGLPVEQVEAILLHELAHIRRHDSQLILRRRCALLRMTGRGGNLQGYRGVLEGGRVYLEILLSLHVILSLSKDRCESSKIVRV